MWRSVINYAQGFTRVALHHPRMLVEDLRPVDAPSTLDRTILRTALGAAVDRIGQAQDQGTDAGIGSYHLVRGWGSSYPETTGYLVPSLLEAGAVLQRPDLEERAMRAADWLLTVQREDGGWQGGRVGEARPSVVFNTAQVVRGLLAMKAHTGDDRYLTAAVRAGRWIVSVQEPDGAWRAHNFLGVARVYDTYVDAPLLALWALTGSEEFRHAAHRNLEWVLGRQQPNGWFLDADNTVRHNDRPITHTITYTIDGLLECGERTGEGAWVQAGRRAADMLLERFLQDRALHGRYDAQWKGSQDALSTGGMQLAIAWDRLHRLTGEQRYAQGAQRMVAWGIGVQRRSLAGPVHVHGMLSGSVPFWGRYENFAYPNWATKYFIDALLRMYRRSAPEQG